MELIDKVYVHRNTFGDLSAYEEDWCRPLYCVEYTRTDAFIEKALSWLKNHYRDYMHNPTGKRLEGFFGIDMCNDFENYMKGE